MPLHSYVADQFAYSGDSADKDTGTVIVWCAKSVGVWVYGVPQDRERKEGAMAKGDIETYHEGGAWKNRVEGGQQPSNTAETKAEAQAKGRRMAIDRGVEHIIKNLDGRIGERNTYPRSRDKNPPKG